MARQSGPPFEDRETLTADEFRDIVETPSAKFNAMGVEFVNLTYADLLDLFDTLNDAGATCEIECVPTSPPPVAEITVKQADTTALYHVASFLRQFRVTNVMQFKAEMPRDDIELSFALGT